jgi:hypothetical protein
MDLWPLARSQSEPSQRAHFNVTVIDKVKSCGEISTAGSSAIL